MMVDGRVDADVVSVVTPKAIPLRFDNVDLVFCLKVGLDGLTQQNQNMFWVYAWGCPATIMWIQLTIYTIYIYISYF